MEKIEERISDNKKIYTHFAEEFIHLRTTIDSMLKALRNINSPFTLPTISSPEEIVNFDSTLKDNEQVKSELVIYIHKYYYTYCL